jgi:hypothetical protein
MKKPGGVTQVVRGQVWGPEFKPQYCKKKKKTKKRCEDWVFIYDTQIR